MNLFDKLLGIVEDNLILIAVFVLTLIILLMIKDEPSLTDNEGFMYLATGIIITGLVNGIIQKNTTQQQKSNEVVTQTLATAAVASSQTQGPVDEVKIDAQHATVNSDVNLQPSSDQPAPPSPRPPWVV